MTCAHKSGWPPQQSAIRNVSKIPRSGPDSAKYRMLRPSRSLLHESRLQQHRLRLADMVFCRTPKTSPISPEFIPSGPALIKSRKTSNRVF
jgi:hypothetical protein